MNSRFNCFKNLISKKDRSQNIKYQRSLIAKRIPTNMYHIRIFVFGKYFETMLNKNCYGNVLYDELYLYIMDNFLYNTSEIFIIADVFHNRVSKFKTLDEQSHLMKRTLFVQFLEDIPFEIQSSEVLGIRINADTQWCVKLVEDVLLCLHQLTKVKSLTDLTFVVVCFLKLRINDSLLLSEHTNFFLEKIKTIFDSYIMDGKTFQIESVEEYFAQARSCLDNYQMVRHSEIIKKITSFSTFCLAFSVFDKFGIQCDKLGYTRIEQKNFREAAF